MTSTGRDRCLFIPHRESFLSHVCCQVEDGTPESVPAGHSAILKVQVLLHLSFGGCCHVGNGCMFREGLEKGQVVLSLQLGIFPSLSL